MKLLRAFSFTVLLFLMLVSANPVQAAGTGSFVWSAASASVVNGTTSSVSLSISTGASQTTGADVYLNYDPTAVDIQGITFTGNPYAQNFSTIDTTLGHIKLTSSYTDVVSSFTGTQTYAQISYKAKQSGATSFAFQCTVDRTNDTNITEKGTSADIVDCASLSAFSLTITNPAANATATPTPTPTATPTTNPASGMCNKPTAPSGLTARAQGTDSVVLQWNRGTNATRYVLQYGTTQGQYQYGVSNLGDTTAFVVGYLQPGKTYYFAIAGANSCGTSSFITVSAKTSTSIGTVVGTKKANATPTPKTSTIPSFATLAATPLPTSPLPTIKPIIANNSAGLMKILAIVGISALILFILLAYLYGRQNNTSESGIPTVMPKAEESTEKPVPQSPPEGQPPVTSV